MKGRTEIHCAIAGLGRIGVTLETDPLREKPASHLGAIEHHKETVLTAASDPDEEKRKSFHADHGHCPVFEDSREMIDSVKPDILHIASDTDTHIPLLRKGLSASVPVIICEKPLANSLEEVKGVLKQVDASGSHVIVNHERRFSADYRDVRDQIRKKSLGELLCVNARLYMCKTRPVAEILYHDGTHMLDILRFLTDKDLIIKQSVGDPYKKSGQLLVIASAGEAFIVLDVSGGRDHLVFELDLSFERGRIRIGNGIYEIWDSEESPFYTGFRSLKCNISGWNRRTGYFSSMMDHAVDLYKNPERICESSFRDGLKVLELIEKILSFHHREGTLSSSSE
jgi:predicted dehydrogenase